MFKKNLLNNLHLRMIYKIMKKLIKNEIIKNHG